MAVFYIMFIPLASPRDAVCIALAFFIFYGYSGDKGSRARGEQERTMEPLWFR
jgi:hypothetical protein